MIRVAKDGMKTVIAESTTVVALCVAALGAGAAVANAKPEGSGIPLHKGAALRAFSNTLVDEHIFDGLSESDADAVGMQIAPDLLSGTWASGPERRRWWHWVNPGRWVPPWWWFVPPPPPPPPAPPPPPPAYPPYGGNPGTPVYPVY